MIDTFTPAVRLCTPPARPEETVGRTSRQTNPKVGARRVPAFDRSAPALAVGRAGPERNAKGSRISPSLGRLIGLDQRRAVGVGFDT